MRFEKVAINQYMVQRRRLRNANDPVAKIDDINQKSYIVLR